MTGYQMLWFFFVYATLGWVLEVCFCSIQTGQFVNRGFLNGAVCPVYGFGMVAVLNILRPVQDNLILLFLGGMVVASTVELIAGWILKKVFNTTWWDYSDEKFNLGGYICLSLSLAWGAGVLFAVRIVHPAVAWIVDAMPLSVGRGLLLLFGIVFMADTIVTVKAVAKLNRSLGRIEEFVHLLHETSDKLAQGIGDTALLVDDTVDNLKEDAQERVESARVETQARLDIARAELLDEKNFTTRRLMKAFPRMKNMRYTDALEQTKQWLIEKDIMRSKKQ